jgi:hypothetical protein
MPITKEFLSAGGGGVPVLIAATATPGTNVHITGISADVKDEITLELQNNHTADVTVTIEWAGTALVNQIIRTLTSKSGLALVIPGNPLAGDGVAGRSVAIFASVANVIAAHGYVNRIAP